MTQRTSDTDTDWGTLALYVGGALVVGILIGAFVGGPLVQKYKDKKKTKKPDTPAK
jgi:uncharacterized integral membrane protein